MDKLVNIYRINNYIDTFALGHYARVSEAIDNRNGETVAFKVMRSEHLSPDGDIRWEYRAFANEAELLTALDNNPHIINMIDCGYLSTLSDTFIDGEIASFGQDITAFADALTDYAERNWRPYITMPSLPRTNNLFYLMKPNTPGARKRLPSEEGLTIAMQFGHVLQSAHRKGIVYLDHKLEHVYWDGTKLEIIDLNSSRQLDSDATGNDNLFRMDVHNLCVGILYPLLTGLSPQKGTLRPQPSGMSEVETRYQGVTSLDFGVEPTLSVAFQELLQRGAAMQIETADDFLMGLQQVAALHGWDFPNQYTAAADREARDQMRGGLRKIREGQACLHDAREMLREAAILEGISEDMEDELRRLIKVANETLNHRVIP